MATCCASDSSALAPSVLVKEFEYTKQRTGKRLRSVTEDESPQPAKKLQQTSASLDLTPLLTNFSTLGNPFPTCNKDLADTKQALAQALAQPRQIYYPSQMNCLSIYSVIFLDKSQISGV